MKNVLFVNQVLYSKGHYDFDSKMIELLSREYNLSVVNPNNWFNLSDNNGLTEIPYNDSLGENHSRFIREFTWTLFLAKTIKGGEYDLVFFVDFVDYLLVSLLFLLNGACRIAVMHHNSLDKIEKGIHKLLFGLYKNKVIHITLEEYMDGFLKSKIPNRRNNCFVVHHKLPYNSNKDCRRTVSLFKWNGSLLNLVALSSSNDYEFYNDLYKLERESETLKKNNIRIIVKLKKYPDSYVQTNNFIAITERISDQDYWSMMNKADGAIIFYEAHFRYRTSGYLSDAMYCHCPVIFRESVMGNYYRDDYSETCMSIKNAPDFIKQINTISELCKKSKPDFFFEYLNLHSDESILLEFSKIV